MPQLGHLPFYFKAACLLNLYPYFTLLHPNHIFLKKIAKLIRMKGGTSRVLWAEPLKKLAELFSTP